MDARKEVEPIGQVNVPDPVISTDFVQAGSHRIDPRNQHLLVILERTNAKGLIPWLPERCMPLQVANADQVVVDIEVLGREDSPAFPNFAYVSRV